MNIIIAGAGHGGLVSAGILAKNGHNVTVFEKKQKTELGHDWEDRFTFSVLSDITGEKTEADDWRYRGDCAFVSPSYRTNVIIKYTDENRQKVMWRKTVIEKLLSFCEKNGVNFSFETDILSPIIENGQIVGIKTSKGDIKGDLVIDSAGAFSPVRMGLDESFGIEKKASRGDLFYAYRAYFNKISDEMPEVPFEVFLCHNKEQGLSWCLVNEDNVDILIGRIDPLNEEKLQWHIDKFRQEHKCIGTEILHGGNYGIIPVRRPLALMVAPGYAAVGDSAFMTTPMNGMGLDLSMQGGKLLADTIVKENSVSIGTLWNYNRDFHRQYGAITAKNEGLKCSLLQMPGEGVDTLFDNSVIQASDLSGAGSNTSLPSLLGKFVRGMKAPEYFFALLGGLMKGAKLKKALESAPESFDRVEIDKWQKKVNSFVLKVTRK